MPLAGLDNKCQIIAVFGATLDGQFLPPQIIYQGKTEACLLAHHGRTFQVIGMLCTPQITGQMR